MPTTVARQRRLDKLLYEPNSTSVSAKQSRVNRELVKVLLTGNSGDHSAAPRVLVIQRRCLATGEKSPSIPGLSRPVKLCTDSVAPNEPPDLLLSDGKGV